MEVKEEDNQTMDTIMRDQDTPVEQMPEGVGEPSKTYRSFKYAQHLFLRQAHSHLNGLDKKLHSRLWLTRAQEEV